MTQYFRVYSNLKFTKQGILFLGSAFISMIFFFGCISNNYAQQKDPESSKTTDEFDIKDASFLMPQALPPWKFSQAISIYYVVLPKDWTMDVIKAPFFNYSCKLALPLSFNLQAGLSTIFVSNRFNAGPFWNYSVHKFHFAAGNQVVFNYGYLSEFGFNTEITGWEQQPSLIAAYSFGKTAVILRGDLYYTLALDLNEGGFVISPKEHFVNGYSVTATFDQRLYRNKVMSIGLKVNYVRYHIIAWPAFPINSYRYVVPEFQLGLNL